MRTIIKSILLVLLLCNVTLAKNCPELVDAAKNGDLDAIKKGVANGCDINSMDIDEDYSVILMAIEAGHMELWLLR